jgi:chromosome segregation ATPase
MADSDAAFRNPNDWPTQGVRQRLGSRIERHVLRSAVDMLDERGADLDTIERELVKREQDLAERLAVADKQETQVAYREQRLAEIGAQDVDATRKIDHLIRQLDETEGAAAALRAKAHNKVLAADEKARELAERVKGLEEAEHRRVLSAADITRRESALRTREHELRQQDERLREREQALGAKQHNLIVLEQTLQRRERELEEREDSIRRQGRRWWGAGPASSPFGE